MTAGVNNDDFSLQNHLIDQEGMIPVADIPRL